MCRFVDRGGKVPESGATIEEFRIKIEFFQWDLYRIVSVNRSIRQKKIYMKGFLFVALFFYSFGKQDVIRNVKLSSRPCHTTHLPFVFAVYGVDKGQNFCDGLI